MSASFEPEQAVIYSSFDTEEHYNLVVKCPVDFQNHLSHILPNLDNFAELALTLPENYHITVAILSLDTVTESLIQRLHAACRGPLTLRVTGMQIRPKGISVNVISDDKELLKLRKTVADIAKTDFDSKDRLANAGWITIGRFIATPHLDLVDLIKRKSDINLGSFKNYPALYRSKNRQSLGEKIW